MNPASQPDSPSEWSKFAPLPPRLRSHSPLSQAENLADDTPSSETASTEPAVALEPTETPLFQDENSITAREPIESTALTTDQFVCQNRKCKERRERRALTPRPLFDAHWRALKIGKRQSLVLDLAVHCPECETRHVYTLVPPEWLEADK